MLYEGCTVNYMNCVNVGNNVNKLEIKTNNSLSLSKDSKDKFNNKYMNMQSSIQSPILYSHSGSPNTGDRKLI